MIYSLLILFFTSLAFAGGDFTSSMTIAGQDTAMIGGWHLNEGAGSFSADVSTNGNHMNSFNGSTSWVTDRYGSGISIDAANSFVTGTVVAGIWDFNRYTIGGWATIKDMGGSGGCNTHNPGAWANCGVLFAVGGGGGDFPMEFGYLPDGNMFVDTGGLQGTFDSVFSSTIPASQILKVGQRYYFEVVGSTTGRNKPNGFGSITFYINGSSVAYWDNPPNPMIGTAVPATALRCSIGRHPASAHGTAIGTKFDGWFVLNSSSSASDVKGRYYSAIGPGSFTDE